MIVSESEQEKANSDEVEVESTDSPPEERRKSYRLNKVLGATLIGDDGEEKATRLFVIDISATGFRATDHTPPDEGECLIQIVLKKGEEPFKSPMRVVWVKELTVSGMYQMGCEFVEPEPEELARLTAFIEEEMKRTTTTKSTGVSLSHNPWTMIS